MNIDWKRKLSSRKLWLAVAGFISGLILAFGGAESTASTVSGCILQGAACNKCHVKSKIAQKYFFICSY